MNISAVAIASDIPGLTTTLQNNSSKINDNISSTIENSGPNNKDNNKVNTKVNTKELTDLNTKINSNSYVLNSQNKKKKPKKF